MGSFSPDSDHGAALGDFLKRPVLIDTFTWEETDSNILLQTLNPWSLYFADPAIKRKLDNYKLIRCKLHLKFVVNSSPFFYGSMRVCYNPLADGKDNYATDIDQVKLSQLPGLFLTPANMTSADLELPFLWPNPWLDVTSNADFLNMGRLSYVRYAVLRSANGVTNASVRVSCYAWAEDVEIAGLTSSMSLQSDEYEDSGVISGPASAVARIAGKLKDSPVLGGLATATEIGASSVANLARLFGFSNPPVISDVVPMAPKSFHAFSSVDTSVPSDKLSLDPKNEVTVDNGVTGAGNEDPLSLKGLVCHESFLQGTLWEGIYNIETILWTAPVSPYNIAQQSSGGQNIRNYTPAAHFGSLFGYWRGSMCYKFTFVKTRYHTGRVIISWDPSGAPGVDYDTTTMVRVVDLQHEEEVIVTVPYKQSAVWRRRSGALNNFSNSTTPSISYDSFSHNGVIQMRVLTTLTGPAATPDIDVLVSCWCGDDIEFAMPDELPTNLSVYELQSTEVASGVANADPEYEVDIVTMGESIVSLRPLLHRTTFSDVQVVGSPANGTSSWVGSGFQTCVNLYPRLPWEYGYYGLAPWLAQKQLSGGNERFGFVKQHPLLWVLNCFVGYRGSVVHHFNVEQNGAPVINYLSASRYAGSHIIPGRESVNGSNRATTGSHNIDQPSTLSRSVIRTGSGVVGRASGHRGMALTNCLTQSGMTVVLPQYTTTRFNVAYGPERDRFPTGSFLDTNTVRVDTSFRAVDVSGSSSWPLVSHYVAAGVDFNPVFFACVPSRYAVPLATAVDSYT
jgi:hypothetical protein